MSMDLCSNGHEEICYDGRDCPACLLLGEIRDLNEELGHRADRARELQDQIDELTDEIRAIGEVDHE